MNAQMSRFLMQARTIACSLALAIMLIVALTVGVSAHPGHEHADEQAASWTERIDEVAAAGAVLLLIGGVFWLSNRTKSAPVEEIPDSYSLKKGPRL